MEKNINPLDNIIDFRELLFKILNNWYYFLLSIFLSLAFAFAYVRYSHELYKSTTKVLIQNNSENVSASEILYENLNSSKESSIKDEIHKFTSYPLVFQTVSDLRFDISYYLVGNIKTSETYITPIKVIADLETTQKIPHLNFEIDFINEDKFNLYCVSPIINKQYNFGEQILIEDYSFKVILDEKYHYSSHLTTVVKFNGLRHVAKQYQSKIKLDKLEKESNIVTLSILEEDQKKGVIFLNKLVSNYITNDLDHKKSSSLNTVLFIKNEINSIEDSLSLIEIELQDYKNSHQIPDLNLKTQNIYQKLSELETELSTYKYQDKYYSYLGDYIVNGNSLDRIVAPSTYGITNSSLSELIKQLVNIQLEKNVLIEGGQYNNPSISDFNLQLVQLSKNIKEVISNSRHSNKIIINDLNARISIEESSLNSLPIEQRELLNIERIQKTSEKLYMFLLQKKSEAEITSSSITSNIQHLEPSSFFVKPPLFPNASLSYSVALLIGVLLPLLLLLLLDLINDKIRSRIDLERISKIDIIGVIGKNHSGNALLSKLNPKSAIAEGFRSLRSNLNYKDKEDKDKIYLVTSSVSGEGKTFIASNLAFVFANSGKKTLLLGADLRRPKLYEGFNVDNSIGLSTVLDGSSSVDEVISNVEENLDIIIAGPVPSNPADVFLSDKFEELINTLKNKYDKIIIDTAPIGLVADGYMIMKHTDVNMYVVRQNYTNKDVLRFVNDLEENNRVENLYLVLNDVSSGSGVYGYGKYSYGYGYGYGSYTKDSDYFTDY